MTSFYTDQELNSIGFKSIGENVLLSRKVSIYSPDKIIIGNNVRIDDFCIISGSIKLGNYIHIAAACLLFGGTEGIIMEDFSGLSSRCAIYAEGDDYSGSCLTNPTIPDNYRYICGGGVIIRKHAIIGSGSTILPGSAIGIGSAVGSMSLVNKPIGDWGIYVGTPCKRIKDRKRDLLELEKRFLDL